MSKEPRAIKSLYLSHNGMVEALGQAQVLPYLRGLKSKGVDVHIVSFERDDVSSDDLQSLKGSLSSLGLGWTPLKRSTTAHHMSYKGWETLKGALKAIQTASKFSPDIVHARSYLPSAIADAVRSCFPNVKFVFDCRGMLADERFDAGQWDRSDLRYRLVKAYEKRLFNTADAVVFLTHHLERLALEGRWVHGSARMSVVPCCVDTEKFKPDVATRMRVRKELGIEDNVPVVMYSGSLGTWYLEDEMLSFVRAFQSVFPTALFMVLSHSDTSSLLNKAKKMGVEKAVRVHHVKPTRMPEYLLAGDVGLSFIKASFSKIGSSPTKVGEYLSAGLVVVTNPFNDDQKQLAERSHGCMQVTPFDDDALNACVRRIAPIIQEPYAVRSARCHDIATAYLSLETIGVPRYYDLYQSLVSV